MLSPEDSRFLAKIKQKAIYNNDIEMIKKIENIQYNYEITSEIKNY